MNKGDAYRSSACLPCDAANTSPVFLNDTLPKRTSRPRWWPGLLCHQSRRLIVWCRLLFYSSACSTPLLLFVAPLSVPGSMNKPVSHHSPMATHKRPVFRYTNAPGHLFRSFLQKHDRNASMPQMYPRFEMFLAG